jgi:hypothetical protein
MALRDGKLLNDGHMPGATNLPERAVIKIQSVKVHCLRAADTVPGTSLGRCIDDYITEERSQGRIPTKLSINLDPPEEERPERMDDI